MMETKRSDLLAEIVKKVSNLPTDELFGVKMYIDGYATRSAHDDDDKKQPEVKGA